MTNAKILLVEDSLMFAYVVRKTLIKLGYEAFEAISSGEEAIKRTAELKPDIVLMDIMLSGSLDGIQSAEIIRQNYDVPIIFLTSCDDIKTLNRAKETGPFGYIIKPPKENELFTTIEMALYRYKMEKELKITQNALLKSETMASIGRLAADVAHNINNPMGFIVSNLGSLQRHTKKILEYDEYLEKLLNQISEQDQNMAEQTKEQLQKIKKATKYDFIIDDISNLIEDSIDGATRISKIVNDLLSFSQMNVEKSEKCNVNRVIDGTITVVLSGIENHQLDVVRDFGKIPKTNMDQQLIYLVFMHLFNNIFHVVEGEAIINIKTWSNDDFIYVSINDRMNKISADDATTIYNPFIAKKNISDSKTMSLRVAYDILKLHDGDITLNLDERLGIIFVVSLPVLD